jgi:hypothetical protein
MFLSLPSIRSRKAAGPLQAKIFPQNPGRMKQIQPINDQRSTVAIIRSA